MTREEIISNFKGILVPVVTPFNRPGDIDFGCFRENLRRYAGSGLAGILVAGSTGEAPYLTERERLRLVEVARDLVRPPELLLAGTGLESTRQTVALSREAEARGADAVLLLTPCYYKARMDSAALSRHFHAVADALRRPVILYNIPQFTGVRMSPDTIRALSRHPNIFALKESSGDLAYVRVILRKVRAGFRVVVGAPVILLDALRAGAAGAVLGLAGFAPEICVGIYDAFQKRQLRTARELQQRLTLLAQKIGVPYGVAGIKAALDLCGYVGGSPRAPLVPLDAAERRAVAAGLREARAGLEC
jgi:4-hydroxy-2-oxoglutarate aldolase